MSSENALTEDEVISQLWAEYKRDQEYLNVNFPSHLSFISGIVPAKLAQMILFF